MESFSLTDARSQLPHLLDRVAVGESFTISRHGSPVAILVGHDEWMKTRSHDVVVKARALGAEVAAMREAPFPALAHFDADEAVAAVYRARGYDDSTISELIGPDLVSPAPGDSESSA